jgi:hypothetical protein
MYLIRLHQIHPFWLGVLVIGFFLVVSLAGLRLTRPLAKRLCRDQNDFVNFFLAAVAVFYAVLVGLIAVACWGNYTSIEGIVSTEALSAADVYRDVESYPPMVRGEVRALLRAYVVCVSREEWPLQRRGSLPGPRGGEIIHQLARKLTAFEPSALGQQVAHIQTLHDLDDLFSNRRLRLEAIDGHLPRLMWLVVLAGAAVMIFMTYFFCAQSSLLHGLLTAGLGGMIGLVAFLIFALDRPLVGSVAIAPDSFQHALAVMQEEGDR